MDYINRWLGSELLMFCILPWGYAAAVALLLILMFSKNAADRFCCGYYYHSGQSWYCCYSRCSTPSC